MHNSILISIQTNYVISDITHFEEIKACRLFNPNCKVFDLMLTDTNLIDKSFYLDKFNNLRSRYLDILLKPDSISYNKIINLKYGKEINLIPKKPNIFLHTVIKCEDKLN